MQSQELAEMRIEGRLRDDVLAGRVVLFMGAGVGQVAGLPNSAQLANYLFAQANSPTELEHFQNDLSRLAAALDANPRFTRLWIDQQLIDFFNDRTRYQNLEFHRRLLAQQCWSALFTTNYDLAFEFADNNNVLVPIVDQSQQSLLRGSINGVRYFKIHGCARARRDRPHNALPFLLTTQDNRHLLRAKSELLQVLGGLAYNCSVVFIGFRVDKPENDAIASSVFTAYDQISTANHQPFRPFAVLVPPEDELARFDLQHSELQVLDGRFEDFVDAVDVVLAGARRSEMQTDGQRNVYLSVCGRVLTIEKVLVEQAANQFSLFHSVYLEEQEALLQLMTRDEVVSKWKSQPTDGFLASHRYIEREVFGPAADLLMQGLSKIRSEKVPRILVVTGDRASGKSVLLRQLAAYAYSVLHELVLTLVPNAFYEAVSRNGTPEQAEGWDGRYFDKFLSQFYHDDILDGPQDSEQQMIVPVLVADHTTYREFALDGLLKYLENHGKPCLLIVSENTSNSGPDHRRRHRLFQLYGMDSIAVPSRLSEDEIALLFSVVSRDRPGIEPRRDDLISRASSPELCNGDLLFILYTWFDRNYRRLDEIIEEEAATLSTNEVVRRVYSSIAVFHQYDFSPRLSLCLESQGISVYQYQEVRDEALVRAFLRFSDVSEPNNGDYVAFTRHPEFARRMLAVLYKDIDEQVAYICSVIQWAQPRDVGFVRDFLTFVFSYNQTSMNVEQCAMIKQASEIRFAHDWVINHQYGAFLIRENVKYDDARYYLDLALADTTNDISRSSIVHSLGNLEFALYRSEEDAGLALEHYERASSHFERSRTLRSTPEEHAYVTNVDMISHRLIRETNMDKLKNALLLAERNSLLFEALTVVPGQRQNYLLRRIQQERVDEFHELPLMYQELLQRELVDGRASPTLVMYYGRSLLARPNDRRWRKLLELVNLYREDDDLTMQVVVALLGKGGFVVPASERFERQRNLFERIVLDAESQLSLYLQAEYVRMLMIDALVLRKFDVLDSLTREIVKARSDYQPRFLRDEYVYPLNCYEFDPTKSETCRELFCTTNFMTARLAQRYTSIVSNVDTGDGRYFQIQVDPQSRFFVRGIRKELPVIRQRMTIGYCIKYAIEGLIAADLRV